jgi:hypothetical protein
MRPCSVVVIKVLAGLLVAVVTVQGASAQSSAKLGAPAPVERAETPLEDPGSLFDLAKSAGATFRILVTGDSRGNIWGDGAYTSDSVLAAAAVHAGLLEQGETGIVTVEVVPGDRSYESSTKNGVTSRPYGPWEIGYRLTDVESVGGAVVLPYPDDLTVFRGRNDEQLSFEVTGSDVGGLWGSGIYSDDSALATAAVHAGVLKPGQSGIVTIEIMPGQTAYEGSESNGVTSQSYGTWDGSYRIVQPQQAKGKLTGQ